MSERRSDWRYPILCVALLAVVLGACLAAYVLGESRHGERTYYFYELGDVGHPGFVNVVGSMGLISTATVSAVLALQTGRRSWWVAALLFVTMAADNVTRAHNQVPGGDVAFRLFYWGVLVWLAVQHRDQMRTRWVNITLLLGVGLLISSEILDLLVSSEHGRGAALEESAACLGMWSIALTMMGVAASHFQPVSNSCAVNPENSVVRNTELSDPPAGRHADVE